MRDGKVFLGVFSRRKEFGDFHGICIQLLHTGYGAIDPIVCSLETTFLAGGHDFLDRGAFVIATLGILRPG